MYELFPWVREAVERATGGDTPELREGDDRLLHALAQAPLEPRLGDSGELTQPARRESEVLRLVLEGLTKPQIGQVLGLSLHTVRSHAKRSRRRFGVDTTWKAAVVAELLGWLPK